MWDRTRHRSVDGASKERQVDRCLFKNFVKQAVTSTLLLFARIEALGVGTDSTSKNMSNNSVVVAAAAVENGLGDKMDVDDEVNIFLPVKAL